MWVARIDEKPLFRKQGIIKATAVCKSVISRKSVHLQAAAAIHLDIQSFVRSAVLGSILFQAPEKEQ